MHIETITRLCFGQYCFKRITISAALIKGNEGGTVSASYSIERPVGLPSYSNALEFRVGAALELSAPSVKEASGASLNPVNAKDLLTIVVPANTALLPEDKIKVTWTGAAGTPPGGSYTSGESLISDGLEIEIPNSVVAFNLNQHVTVSYGVIRGAQEIPSLVFDLAVQQFSATDLVGSTPNVDGADNSANTLAASVKPRP